MGLPIPDIVGDKKNCKNENKIFNKIFIDNDHKITSFSSFCNITNPFPFLHLSYDKYQILNLIFYDLGKRPGELLSRVFLREK